MIEPRLDLGTRPSKVTSTDELLTIMRDVVAANPDSSHTEAVKLWLDRVQDHEDYDTLLLPAIERYAGNALWRRCVVRKDHPEGEPDRRETKAKAKEIIASEIVLWTWKLPTTGKALCEATFQEVAEAAPLAGRFLSKLSTMGAPGSLVREVFNKQELQEFWAKAQGAAA